MSRPLPHGTANCYNNHGCRREECRAAIREERRARRAANPAMYAERQRRWREANPEKVAAQLERRRVRKRERAAEARAAAEAATPAALAAARVAAGPFTDLLQARAHALAVVISRAPLSLAAREARVRRDEILALLAEVTA